MDGLVTYLETFTAAVYLIHIFDPISGSRGCNAFVTHHAERDLVGIAKRIDPGHPAQADHGRHFSLLADFLCIK